MVLVVKNLPAKAGAVGDAGLIPGSGRSPLGGHSNALRFSCLENPMDRGAWQPPVHGAAKSQTWLKRLSMHSHTHTKCQHGITFLGSPDSAFLVYNLTTPLSCPVIHLMVIGKEKASRDFLPTLLGPGDPCQWEKLTIDLSYPLILSFDYLSNDSSSNINVFVKISAAQRSLLGASHRLCTLLGT